MQVVFGEAIKEHSEYQYDFFDRRIVGLRHDASDVGHMHPPYLHEPNYFRVPEVQQSLMDCTARPRRWADEFVTLQV